MSRIYFVFVLLISMTVLVSYEDNPPNGKTGAPGDGLCTDCHSLDGGMQNGSIVVTGFPSVIQPSTAYVLTITNSNPNGMADLGGFQMTVLNSNNQKAGTLTSPSPNSVVTPSGGRDYWEHDPAQSYPGNNMVSWTVTWTSPSGPPNDMITVYSAGNVANGNGNTSGDLIVTSTNAGTLDGGAGPLQVDIVEVTDVSCFGGNDGAAVAEASDGMPGYTYLWSNGQMGPNLTNVADGTYTVTVTDNTPSTATASVVIDQPNQLSLSAPAITHVSCFGGNNGAITANATGGTGGYAYAWSNGSSGATITNLTAGSYSVTVTDVNDCTNSATYTVNQPAELTINLVSLQDESCFGAEDGSITIETFGGTMPVFAEWSNGFIGTTISDLAPDVYSVTVTDNNNCTATASYMINTGGVVNVTLEQIQHASCNGASDGAISVSANGGQAPYSFNWSNGDSGPDITGLAAGNYLVTVTDDNGCDVVNLYTINQPAPIAIQIQATGENMCAGDSLVDLLAVVTGSQPPYTGSWSNGVQGLANDNLPAGTYTITVTDQGGCTAISSYTIVPLSTLIVSVNTTDETSSGANDGTAVALASGGTPDYSYAWSNGETTDSIGGLVPGTYTVTVTDMNGCTVTGSGQVDPFGCLLAVDLGPDIVLCGNDTATITAVVTGAVGPFTYLWSDNSTLSSIEVTMSGEYCVTVTDSIGCEVVTCVNVIAFIFPEFMCPVTNESAPGMNDGAILCDTISGVATYLWSNGATTPSITGLSAGEYCVTMTTFLGCEGVQCFDVEVDGCQFVVLSLIDDVLCSGDSSGSISVNVENAIEPVTYNWFTGDTTATISNLSGGNYAVIISDGSGCSKEITFTVAEPEALSITIDSVAVVQDFDSGAIFISVAGGTMPYTYLWTDPNNDQFTDEDLENLFVPGYYSVMVSDANGCPISVDSIFVDQDVAVRPQPQFKQLSVYPVPTDNMLIIDFEHVMTEVLISGVDGRLYKRILNPASNRLEVGELESGWYILRMTDGESWYVARMIK